MRPCDVHLFLIVRNNLSKDDPSYFKHKWDLCDNIDPMLQFHLQLPTSEPVYTREFGHIDANSISN